MAKYIYTSVVVSLLVLGIYISFELQKDFLIQVGLRELLAICLFIFFDGSKIIAEVVFFRISHWIKPVVGVYAILLIIVSAFATGSVRLWKSEEALFQSAQENVQMETTVGTEQSKRTELQRLIDSYYLQVQQVEAQITSIQTQINGLDPRRYVTTVRQYQRDIETKQQEKSGFLAKIEQYRTELSAIPLINREEAVQVASRREVGLLEVIYKILDANAEPTIVLINTTLALLLELTILFLCSVLSTQINAFKVAHNLRLARHSEAASEAARSRELEEMAINLRARAFPQDWIEKVLVPGNVGDFKSVFRDLEAAALPERPTLLKKLRSEALKMNQSKFGDLIGLTQVEVSELERGEVPITDTILQRLKVALK